jgi:hypothetical protein
LLATFDDPEIELFSQENKYGPVKAASMRIRTRLVSAEAIRKESTTGEVAFILSVNGVEVAYSRWDPDVSPEQAKTTIECACFATGRYDLYGITVARVERGAEGKERGQQAESCDARNGASGADGGIRTRNPSASSNLVRNWIKRRLRMWPSKPKVEATAKPVDYVRTGAFKISAPNDDVPDNWCGPVSPFTELWDMDLDQEEWFRLL